MMASQRHSSMCEEGRLRLDALVVLKWIGLQVQRQRDLAELFVICESQLVDRCSN